jgi:hypothetical protein
MMQRATSFSLHRNSRPAAIIEALPQISTFFPLSVKRAVVDNVCNLKLQQTLVSKHFPINQSHHQKSAMSTKVFAV